MALQKPAVNSEKVGVIRVSIARQRGNYACERNGKQQLWRESSTFVFSDSIKTGKFL